jgi:hypothetical protein
MSQLLFLLALHPLFKAHPDSLVDALETIQRRSHIKREYWHAELIRRGRIIVDDISSCSSARCGSRNDPIVPVEWRFRAECQHSGLDVKKIPT